ncbi:hypothetical protein Cfla_2368 [Cellulomonas flavigena DSM 20109]|uniref:Uncharacterized protein n=1 Tax=Cellulomonas flavigena (strain ATCC 482 / DSM 20109 / BCRC 11376 / JCM 18109 / NBRC 3775 / NCIMB 8073 / NRS 134) TaxID=446466 RepID=D5UHD7_CELFN|nr:hypothetical protein [Cellulomonas flavigena]ADG75258.1 hypothetical protein Cfla_2368 [Cellulomonas flavigena DSM 20109]
MPSPRFVSFAADAEDVVLWRALGRQAPGRYLDASAPSPDSPSVTRAFHDAGWSGVVLAATDATAVALRAQRPRDVVVTDVEEALGAAGGVDLVVADRAVLARVLGAGAAPAVVVLTGVPHGTSPDPVDGFAAVQAVGSSHVLVADGRTDLAATLSSPPSVRADGYERAVERDLRAERDEAVTALMRWRATALAGWPGAAPAAAGPDDSARTIAELAHELHKVRSTLSWRVTAPLRAVSGTAAVRRVRGR